MGRISGILRPLLRQQQQQHHHQQFLRRKAISSSSSSPFLPSSTSFSPASRTFYSAAVKKRGKLMARLIASNFIRSQTTHLISKNVSLGGFLWPNIKKLSDSLPQVGSKPTIQNLGISSVPTRHFSSKGFRPGGSNFGSIRSSADWFHLLNKKKEWYLRLKKKKACRLLLKSQFLKKLHSSIQEKDLKDLDADKKFKYKKGCLGSSFAERNRMKRHFFHSGILNLYIKEKGMNDKNLNHPTQTRRSIDSSYKLSDLIYCCASSYQFSMKKREGRSKTKIKKIELPTHISEVNHKTLQAVISYAPTYSELPGYVKRRLGSGAVTTR